MYMVFSSSFHVGRCYIVALGGDTHNVIKYNIWCVLYKDSYTFLSKYIVLHTNC